ncbi:DUF5344 family protein [Metabacillus fastidiosus]|uniref:DUF5344 family protein n=1 Tax=Metabacillus fastidiosus TaxID=1458 RepID=UPI002E22A0F5|nr:DUF5344 family protein [Metabacillus fastidiosus]
MKVRYGDVEASVFKIDSRTETLQTDAGKEIASGNKLNIVKKLNELNSLLEEVGKAYKQLIRENNESVRKSLQELKETDVKLSSYVKSS